MILSRRQWLRILAVGLGTGVGSTRAMRLHADAREYPVIVRRVLIPVRGATLPALLARPSAVGQFPSRVVLTADESQLRRLASQGRVVLAPLRPLRDAARAEAVQLYLSKHPAVLG